MKKLFLLAVAGFVGYKIFAKKDETTTTTTTNQTTLPNFPQTITEVMPRNVIPQEKINDAQAQIIESDSNVLTSKLGIVN